MSGIEQETARRMAANEATFRRYNEEIRQSAEELAFEGPIPFICECGNERCREILRLTKGEYEDVRAAPTHFFVVPGHESVAGPAGRVRARGERFFVVEKIGVAGEEAAVRDPRRGTETK